MTESNLQMSENINEIAEALSNFQCELSNVHKDKKGYGYTYADLAGIYDAIRPLLAKNGLSHVQPISSTEDNVVIVENLLMHKSGQYMKSSMRLTVNNTNKKMNDWQAIGSAITYLRRYSIASMLGIATTDDDAVTAPEITQVNTRSATDMVRNAVKKQPPKDAHLAITELVNNKKIPDDVIEGMLTRAEVTELKDLPADKALELFYYLNKKYN